jgi:hypothetical protein
MSQNLRDMKSYFSFRLPNAGHHVFFLVMLDSKEFIRYQFGIAQELL